MKCAYLNQYMCMYAFMNNLKLDIYCCKNLGNHKEYLYNKFAHNLYLIAKMFRIS